MDETKPRIIVLIGLPGSGKSTWVAGKPGVLSSDALRGMLIDDLTNQTIHGRVFRVMRYLLKQRLELRRPVTYIDATNLTPKDRRPFIKMAELLDAEIEAVFFDASFEECLRRNLLRDRVVPEDAIRAMAQRLVAPSMSEGFSKVTWQVIESIRQE